jgi:hypothetical protein
VEQRLRVLQEQLNEVRSERPANYGHRNTSENEAFRISSSALLDESAGPLQLPARLGELRIALVNPFDELKGADSCAVSVEEAVLLWDLCVATLPLG